MNRFAKLLSVVAGVVLLWTAVWFVGAGLVRAGVASAAGGSPVLACAKLDIAGYPFRFDITCSGLTLSDGDKRIELFALRISALVYRPNFAELTASAPAAFSDAFTGASYRLDWDVLQADIRLDWLSLARASLVADGLVLEDSVLDTFEMARIGHAEFHARGTDGALGKDRRNIRLNARVENAMAPQLDAPLSTSATVLVTEWPADIRDWLGSALLPDWAAGDGAIEIEQADLATGALSASLSGTLQPDAAGRIDGSLDLASRGFSPLMQHYFAAPLAGVLLGPEDEDGTAHQTLTFSHSILSAGIVPLIELPPLF